MPIQLLLIPHQSHETIILFKIHKISLDTIQNTAHTHQTKKFQEIVNQISPFELGHAGIVDFHLIYQYQIKEKGDGKLSVSGQTEKGREEEWEAVSGTSDRK